MSFATRRGATINASIIPLTYMPIPQMHLSGRHGLGHQPLKGQLLLLEVLSAAVVELKSSHSVADGALDLLLLATLELEGESRVGDNLLNSANVGLELLLGLESLAESLIVALESLGVADHLLDLAGGELTDGVGDGDVGTSAGGLLSGGNLEDTVDVDLEDDLKDGLTSPHRRDRGKSELTQRGVVLAVDTLTLEDGELNLTQVSDYGTLENERANLLSAGCRRL